VAWIDPWRGVPFDPNDPLKSMAIVKRPSNDPTPSRPQRNPADCPARYKLVPD
jgi:hypothetical protein